MKHIAWWYMDHFLAALTIIGAVTYLGYRARWGNQDV